MKKRYLLTLAILIGLGMGWILLTRRSAQNTLQTQKTNSVSVQQALPNNISAQKLSIQPPNTPAGNSVIAPAVMEYVRRIKADPQYDWKQPVNFYGRVVDENNVAVADANIHFKLNDLSQKGTSDWDLTSDSNGGFSLTNKKGKYLYVTVGKQGYYSSDNSVGSGFEYANPANGLFTPDAGNPVVFHLRKKGVGADLITSQYGMSTDFPIHIPHDGKPIMVDFLQRKTGDSGQMQITESKPEFSDWKSATNWWFRLEIPDGGLVEQSDEFPFEAPETNYQSSIEYNFQQNQPDWILNLKKDYYIKFGNPPRYGRLHLETGISYGGAILVYAINPDGSRNLEPK